MTMDLPIIKQTIIADFKADTKKAVDGLDALKRHVTRVTDAWSAGFDVANKVLDIAKFAGQMRDLERAVPSGALQRMRDATRGTVSDLELMRLGARGLTGDLKINEKQLGLVTEAAYVLSRRGLGSTVQVSEKLIGALQKNGRGLDDLGIKFEKTGNEARDTKEMLEAISRVAADTSQLDKYAQTVDRASATLENFSNTVKKTIGDAVAYTLQGISDLATGDESGLGDFFASATGTAPARELAKRLKARQDEIDRFSSTMKERSQYGNGARFDFTSATFGGKWSGLGVLAKPAAPAAPTLAAAADDTTIIADILSSSAQALRGAAARLAQRSLSSSGEMTDWLNPNASKLAPFGAGGLSGESEDASTRRAGLQLAMGMGTAGASGGGKAKVQPGLAPGVEEVATAMQPVVSGFAAAVDAAITGQESMVTAFKKAAAMEAKGMAINATLKAGYETALGIGSLIFSPATAGAHFAAAAKFAVVAAAAGYAASELGGAAGSVPSVGSGTASTPAGGGFLASGQGAGSMGPTSVTVKVGLGFEGNPEGIARAVTDAVRSSQSRTLSTRVAV